MSKIWKRAASTRSVSQAMKKAQDPYIQINLFPRYIDNISGTDDDRYEIKRAQD